MGGKIGSRGAHINKISQAKRGAFRRSARRGHNGKTGLKSGKEWKVKNEAARGTAKD